MSTSNLPDLAHTWLAFLDEQGKAPSTIRAYRRGLAHFVRWSEITYGESFDPASILPRDVRDWIAHQQTVERARPSTINGRLAAVSRFFKWAVEQDVAPKDPTALVKGLRLERRRPKALGERSLRRFLRAVHKAEDSRDIAIVELLLGTGLRVSEAVTLQCGDVVLDARSGSVTVRRSKTGAGREVPLTSEVRRALRAYLDAHPDLGDDDPLWVGQRGPLTDSGAIWRIVKKYALTARIEDISPHTLRHTFATRYLQAHPGDLRGLAAILGHASLNTVMIYTEPTTEDLARRMEEAEAARDQ